MRRGGPLKRTSPLVAHKQLETRTELPRSEFKRNAPMPRTATDAAKKDDAKKPRQATGQSVPQSVRTAVYRRDGDQCQRCGLHLGNGSRQLQHRVARGAGGRVEHWRMSALVLLCGPSSLNGCHGEVEANPSTARNRGFRVPAGVDPTTHPMYRFDGEVVLLSDDGAVTPIPSDSEEVPA